MSLCPITVILPVHNEEKNIRECLQSVSFADDVIVVNGESSDRTRDLAAQFPVRILDTYNDFAEGQRLKALALARHPWIFLIDADERVTPGLKESILRAVADPDAKSAYFVRRKNLYRQQAVHMHDPDFQLRLFKRSATTFPSEIHRKPEIRGTIGKLDGDLLHYFFTDIHSYLVRLNNYTSAESSYDGKRAAQSFFKMLFLQPFGRFFQYYFIRRGFLDGTFGFFYSVSSAYYEFVSAAKYLTRPDVRRSTETGKS